MINIHVPVFYWAGVDNFEGGHTQRGAGVRCSKMGSLINMADILLEKSCNSRCNGNVRIGRHVSSTLLPTRIDVTCAFNSYRRVEVNSGTVIQDIYNSGRSPNIQHVGYAFICLCTNMFTAADFSLIRFGPILTFLK